MDWLNYTLFTIGSDTPVLLIDLLTSVLGLTCVFLAGRNNKYNFWVGYLYTIGLTLMFFNKHLYASLLLQPLSLGINVLGHYRWSHPRKGEEVKGKADELKVTMHLMVGHVFMPIVCALYLINGIVSLVGWMKLYRKENQ